ncbi:hypothetical protein UFOVP650_78 [uncultured Caudovirales phage]|uniref:Uncharacterized protein n=1 Tax=uncultured Caudovirales phage TaxID=2100421 RepID=A0A6J5N9C4_9CAUD|nr:hypothetical protein UFOVP650_78 [uncultured Caudovirales phage]
MGDWKDRERAARANVRAKVQADGEKLLDMVVGELVARGRSALAIRGKERQQGWSGRAFLKLDGANVPFAFQQAIAKGSFSRIEREWLEVSCNGVYRRNSHFKAKTFARSAKSRQDSFGFDVEKIADHLEAWLAAEIASKAKAELHESVLDQWEAIEQLLRGEFPGVGERQLRASAKGLELNLVANESQARRIFEVLGLKRDEEEQPQK